MPTYEYLCRHCGHRFEIWQHMTDDPLTVCPECGEAIHRVLYPAGIVFKGSGFYKTEYGPSGGSNGKHASGENAGEKPSEKPSESGASKSTSESSKSESTSKPSAPATTAAD